MSLPNPNIALQPADLQLQFARHHELYRNRKGENEQNKDEREALRDSLPGHLPLVEIPYGEGLDYSYFRDEHVQGLHGYLVEHERVHRIANERKLIEERLALPGANSNRHAYALVAPWDQTPIIVVYTHLDQEKPDRLPGQLGDIIGERARYIPKASRMVFYSISHTASDSLMSGIPFGGALLKRIMQLTMGKYDSPYVQPLPKGIETFTTLSPVTGLRAWVEQGLHEQGMGFFTEQERALAKDMHIHRLLPKGERGLQEILSRDFFKRAGVTGDCFLMLIGYRYLTEVKDPERPLWSMDRVATSHRRNGAILGGIHPWGNDQDYGWDEGLSMMANHLYTSDLNLLTERAAHYEATGKTHVTKGLQMRMQNLYSDSGKTGVEMC